MHKIDFEVMKNEVHLYIDDQTFVLTPGQAKKLGRELFNEFGEISWT